MYLRKTAASRARTISKATTRDFRTAVRRTNCLTRYSSKPANNSSEVIDNVTCHRLQTQLLSRAENDPRLDCVLLPFPNGDVIYRECGNTQRNTSGRLEGTIEV